MLKIDPVTSIDGQEVEPFDLELPATRARVVWAEPTDFQPTNALLRRVCAGREDERTSLLFRKSNGRPRGAMSLPDGLDTLSDLAEHLTQAADSVRRRRSSPIEFGFGTRFYIMVVGRAAYWAKALYEWTDVGEPVWGMAGASTTESALVAGLKGWFAPSVGILITSCVAGRRKQSKSFHPVWLSVAEATHLAEAIQDYVKKVAPEEQSNE